MTVPSTRFREDYAGNGSATSFPYAFRIFKATDLVVTKTDSSGNETTLTLGTDYTVSGAGSYNGGAVVLTTALPTSYRLTIERVLSIKQETDLRNQGEFLAETHEDAFDRLTMIVQRLAGYLGMGQDGVVRTLLLGKTDIDGQGAYDARSNRIKNLDDPIENQDAATKLWALNTVAASMTDGAGNAVLQLLASNDPDKGASLVGYEGAPLSIWLGKKVMATESRFGLSESGTGAANLAALQAFSAYLEENSAAGWIPFGIYNVSGSGFKIPSSITLHCDGTILLSGSGSKGVLLDNTKYANVYGLKISVTAADQTALSIRGDTGHSELNNFYGLLINSETLPAGTVGIELNNSFSNFFYGARVLRVATQVSFSNASNANIFYGGELRSNNTLANGSYPIIHGDGCRGNAFIGTVIENQRAPIKMDGGELTLMGRCYLEAFYSAEAVQMNGGSLTIDGNYLNNAFVFVNGGSILRYLNNDVDGASSNANYPFVQYRADVNTQLELRGNKPLQTGAVIYRPREWYNGAAWAYRSIANRVEFVQSAPVRFQSRLASDALDVTGDGTTYQLSFGGNEQFDDGSNVGSSFTAPENGLYQFELSAYVSGIVTANHDNITAKVVTSNRSYTIWFSGVDGVQSTGGQMIFRGTCFADMETGDTAYLTIQVTGSSKVVDILRGDAVNGYTSFSGFKVA